MFRFSRRIAVAVAALAVSIPAFAASAEAEVYWSTNNAPGQGSIVKADETSTASPIPVTQVLAGLFGAQSMTIDGGYLYWASPNQIQRLPLPIPSPTPAPEVVVRAIFTAGALAVDSANQVIYFTTLNQQIGKASLVAGSPTITYIPTFGTPTGLAVDHTHGYLYWTSSSTKVIGRVPLSGGAAQPVYLSGSQGLTGAYGIAVDNAFLYWANGGESIGRAPLDGSSPPTPFFISGAIVDPGKNAAAATGMAVQNGFIYWTNHVSYTIGRVAATQNATPQNTFIYALLDPTALAFAPVIPGPQPPPAPLTIASLKSGVQLLGLPGGIERSLLATLDAGQRALDDGNVAAACQSLDAYIRHVDAQSGKHIESPSATGLVAIATQLAVSLGCSAE